MLKLTFNKPLPYSERQHLIHSLKKLGFKYEHIFSDGQYSKHKFSGSLINGRASPDIDLYLSDEAKEQFKDINLNYVEIYFFTERKNDI